MKIYDISQEVYGCNVFPGDPSPQKEIMCQISEGDICNLTGFKMCAHNGTHVDAPYHFYDDGKTIDEMKMECFIGLAFVAEHEGEVTGDDDERMLEKAKQADERSAKRILIKGKAVVSVEAAEVFAKENVLLIGNESQTVGPENAPKQVHLIMLGAEITLLEDIRLAEVPEGVYLLNAAPLNLAGADGAPCRAVLMTTDIA